MNAIWCNCVKKPEKNSGLQRGLNAIPVRCSNQLSYEATDVGSTGIARSRVQTLLKSWIFFRLLYATASNCVHNCEDHPSLDFNTAVHIWFISYTSFWKFSIKHLFDNFKIISRHFRGTKINILRGSMHPDPLVGSCLHIRSTFSPPPPPPPHTHTHTQAARALAKTSNKIHVPF